MVWFNIKDCVLIEEIIDKEINQMLIVFDPPKKKLLKLALLKEIGVLRNRLETEGRFKKYIQNNKSTNKAQYIQFNESNFKKIYYQYISNQGMFGGVIYSIEIEEKFYVGITERNIFLRFEEHIIDAFRYYHNTRGDGTKPGFGKLQQAIIKVTSTLMEDFDSFYPKIKYYSSTQQYKKRRALINKIIRLLENHIKLKVLEIHYNTCDLGIREKFYTKSFPISELYGKTYNKKKEIDLKRHGLNMVYGGGGSGYVNLPIYDIIIMVALGLSSPQISKYLIQNYGILRAKTRNVQDRIADVLGGVYQAQYDYLRSILENLLKIKEINRHDIYLIFKNAELLNGWFLSWSYGEEYLNLDIVDLCKRFHIKSSAEWSIIEKHLYKRKFYYVGISEEHWLNWVFNSTIIFKGKGSPLETIEERCKLGQRKIKNIFKIIFAKFDVKDLRQLRYKLHKEKAEGLIKQGYICISNNQFIEDFSKKKLTIDNYHQLICKYIFKLSYYGSKPSASKNYFEKNLFKGFNVETIWERYREQ